MPETKMRNGNRSQVSHGSHGTGAFTNMPITTGNSAVAGSSWPAVIPMSTLPDEEDGVLNPHYQMESDGEYDNVEDGEHHQQYGHGEQEMGDHDDNDNDGHDDHHHDPNESLLYSHHYLNTNQMLGHHPQSSYYTAGLDGYLSDDVDMSDDAGAPLVDYLQVANLLTNDMDTDVSDAGGDHGNFPYELSMEPENEDSISMTSSLSDEEQFSQYPPAPPAPFTPFTLGLVNQMLATNGQGWPSTTTATQVISGIINQVHPQLPPTTLLDTFPHPTHGPNFHSMTSLGPNNHCLTEFLYTWARPDHREQGVHLPRGPYPWPSRIADLASQKLSQTHYTDLAGDQCDFQGVDWEELGVTRQEARQRRLLTYRNYVNVPGSDRWDENCPDISLPCTDSFFKFRRMDFKSNINLSHFQLRNILATTSRTKVFYPGTGAVHQFNPVTGKTRVAMKLGDAQGSHISTMAAGNGVLIAGSFNGEYTLRHVDSDEPDSSACHEGIITSNQSGITNHAQVYQDRNSNRPLVGFASNDAVFRVLDINTQKWLSHEVYEFPLNCTAVSPDRRLRVAVGDHKNVFITTTESTLGGGKPQVLQELSGHRDHGFSCAWADDGWTVATGFQDKAIKIWDARRWTDSNGSSTPVCTVRAEMAGVRNLQFSPIGSGKRVLVAAEEADYINIIDAQTFQSKQTVDVFAEIGGVSFTNSGQDLTVLCYDPTRGGLLQLERCGMGQMKPLDMDERGFDYRYYGRHLRESGDADWPRSSFTDQKRIDDSVVWRSRRRAALAELEPF
ncbi:WD40-repeat-containing domain protein [Sordaria brevicollis]|uniref:WD40-repeat-containing domain protein n=1 Tax=Sordaria brevicollis TaxID=83679 RepID=A0AAE0PDA6_SORBR|nr:WD40-repeat-containing domain protein [Sordaria brevicollis]